MTTKKIEDFHVIGISVRTKNENQETTRDIAKLWNDFMSRKIMNKIPNKIEDTLYAIYTDYESDHSGEYTIVVGCKVSSLEVIPLGMVGTTVKTGDYAKFMAKGDVTKAAIPDAWEKIWKTDLNRVYASDFEVYDDRAMDPTNAEVDIFIGVN